MLGQLPAGEVPKEGFDELGVELGVELGLELELESDGDGNGAICALPGGANSVALSFSFASLFAVAELSSLATSLVFPETVLVSAHAQFRLPTTK